MNIIAGILLAIMGIIIFGYVLYIDRIRKRLERHFARLIREGERINRIFDLTKRYQTNLQEVFESLQRSNTERYEFYCEKLANYTVELEAAIEKIEKERADDPIH